jgi:predicted alpha/beta-hydrolase family hydrolase
MTSFLIDGPSDAKHTFVFAHGAGGPMVSPFMKTIARGIAAAGIRVVRFEFPYMAARRRRPDPQKVLLECWRYVVSELGDPGNLVIGGKSMGGRMASLVADELGVAGLLCYGYPFHPPGRPERLRTEHLQTLRTRSLIVQGTRDRFGSREEVVSYALAPTISIEWILEGDHSLGKNLDRPIALGVSFITSL